MDEKHYNVQIKAKKATSKCYKYCSIGLVSNEYVFTILCDV